MNTRSTRLIAPAKPSFLIDALVATCIVGFPLTMAAQSLLDLPAASLTFAGRAFNAALALLVLLFAYKPPMPNVGWQMFAMFAFAALYAAVMYSTLIIEGQSSLASPSVMFGLFLGVGILPALTLLGTRAIYIDQTQTRLLIILVGLNTAFLIAALYNGRELIGTQFGRFKTEESINQIYLGHMAVLNLYVAYLLATDRRLRGILPRIALGFVALFSFYMVINASSRGPIAAFIIVAALLAMSRFRTASGMALTASALFAGIMILYYLDPLQVYQSTGSNLLIRLAETDDLTNELRWQVWTEGVELFTQSPLYGGNLLVNGTYPHNYFVEALMATGVIGTSLFLALFIPAWTETLAAVLQRRIGFGHLLFAHMSVNYFLSGSIWGMHMLWIAMSLVLAQAAHVAWQSSLRQKTHAPVKHRGERFSLSSAATQRDENQ